jgi:type IV fimbrial biogenesis protein FimT
MASQPRPQRIEIAAAFTLVELVLAVALILLLAGAVILSFSSLESHSRLEEGAYQVEALFRYARAEAANTGRQVRIVFGADLSGTAATGSQTNLAAEAAAGKTGVQVLWEPNPLTAPGSFEPLSDAKLLVEQVNDLVKVQAVGQPGAFSSNAGFGGTPNPPLMFEPGGTNQVTAADPATNSPPPLTCYPDGSSDSMEVVLSSASNGDENRLALVTFSGLAGRARHRILTVDLVMESSSAGQSHALSQLTR